MPLTINSLRELDQQKIATTLRSFAQLMQERHPEVELTRGAFHDLVLYFNSVLNEAVRENVQRVLNSRSLLQITQNPALAEPELVDHVLSNFNIARGAGSAATGSVTFTFLLPVVTTIAAGQIYTAENATFSPTTTFTILPPGASSSISDAATTRVMIAVGDGTYTATIPFAAREAGSAGNIKRGSSFTSNVIPSNVAGAFASSDFIGGSDPLTNEEYLRLLSAGLAAKTIGGRKSFDAFIRTQPSFSNILHTSVLGAGDAEQQRDQHSLFPISGGGKIDLYTQTHSSAQQIDHIVEATYMGVSTGGTIWQAAIGRDAAPGFYDVVRVAPLNATNTNGYAVTKDLRGVDLSQITYVPDILHVTEGVYSRYQTAIIQFEDSDTLSSGLTPNKSKALYTLTTRGMPLIADLQDTLTSRDNRPRGADLLVKAAVPCFTSISFEIRLGADELIEDAVIGEIKRAVVRAVSGVGFSGQLHSSLIASAAHEFLSGRQAVGHIDMFGKIRRPDGTYGYLRDGTLLTIPDDPARFVTGRTTVFMCSVDDVSITQTAAGFTL